MRRWQASGYVRFMTAGAEWDAEAVGPAFSMKQ